jgi:hypothetical protein
MQGKTGRTGTRLYGAAVLAIGLLSGCASAPRRPAQIAQQDYAAVGQYLHEVIGQRMKQHGITGPFQAVLNCS